MKEYKISVRRKIVVVGLFSLVFLIVIFVGWYITTRLSLFALIPALFFANLIVFPLGSLDQVFQKTIVLLEDGLLIGNEKITWADIKRIDFANFYLGGVSAFFGRRSGFLVVQTTQGKRYCLSPFIERFNELFVQIITKTGFRKFDRKGFLESNIPYWSKSEPNYKLQEFDTSPEVHGLSSELPQLLVIAVIGGLVLAVILILAFSIYTNSSDVF